VRLVVLADTHVPRRARDLPAEVWAAVEQADAVLHAGDWVDVALLDELERRSARVIGVYGNNDGPALRARLPEVARVTLGGVRFAVVHETGGKQGREQRVAASYPDVDVLVFGHSHIPWDSTAETGLRLLNPGSPTDRRREPDRDVPERCRRRWRPAGGHPAPAGTIGGAHPDRARRRRPALVVAAAVVAVAVPVVRHSDAFTTTIRTAPDSPAAPEQGPVPASVRQLWTAPTSAAAALVEGPSVIETGRPGRRPRPDTGRERWSIPAGQRDAVRRDPAGRRGAGAVREVARLP
jgi:putative phosphoesterase